MWRVNQKIYRHIEGWRDRAMEGEFPYLFLEGVVLNRTWADEVRNVSVVVAIGVGTDGHRRILGVAEAQKEDLEGWRGFLRHLKVRGLAGVQLLVSDACLGLTFPSNHWRHAKTNAPLERSIRDIRGRTRVVHALADGPSALMLVAARVRHIASTNWGKRRNFAMETLLTTHFVRRQLLEIGSRLPPTKVQNGHAVG